MKKRFAALSKTRDAAERLQNELNSGIACINAGSEELHFIQRGRIALFLSLVKKRTELDRLDARLRQNGLYVPIDRDQHKFFTAEMRDHSMAVPNDLTPPISYSCGDDGQCAREIRMALWKIKIRGLSRSAITPAVALRAATNYMSPVGNEE